MTQMNMTLLLKAFVEVESISSGNDILIGDWIVALTK